MSTIAAFELVYPRLAATHPHVRTGNWVQVYEETLCASRVIVRHAASRAKVRSHRYRSVLRSALRLAMKVGVIIVAALMV